MTHQAETGAPVRHRRLDAPYACASGLSAGRVLLLVRLLRREQLPLAFQAPAVADHPGVLTNDPVAGDEDRNRVGSAGPRHCPRRAGLAEFLGDLAITLRLAERMACSSCQTRHWNAVARTSSGSSATGGSPRVRRSTSRAQSDRTAS